MRPNYGAAFLIKSVLSTAIMGVLAWFVYQFSAPIVGNTIALLAAVVAGGVVYLFALLVLRALKKEDVEAMPGSKKILKLIGRFL